MSKEEFISKTLPLRPKLESYAFTYLKNKEEVEDIIQEAYVKLWCIRQKLNEYNSIEALSYAITKNLSLNRLKVKQRNVDSEKEIELEIENMQPDSKLIDKDNLEKVLKIVDHLPTLQQSILKMRHLEGLEIAEIAELTGSNEGAIRTNLSRARNKVRTLFMEMDSYEKR